MLGERWDAVFSDFQQYYGINLRSALTEMPAVDLMSLIKKLPPESALAREESGPWGRWDAHKENTARLLEVMSYRLDLEWSDRTTDPDDPDVKQERARAKRERLKPPDRPIVPPVAMRPRELAEEHAQQYAEAIAAHQVKASPVPQISSRSSFEATWGMDP